DPWAGDTHPRQSGRRPPSRRPTSRRVRRAKIVQPPPSPCRGSCGRHAIPADCLIVASSRTRSVRASSLVKFAEPRPATDEFEPSGVPRPPRRALSVGGLRSEPGTYTLESQTESLPCRGSGRTSGIVLAELGTSAG
ncbi:hypothetical protein THAOC_36843, partial [Thalassiosira oceanica]